MKALLICLILLTGTLHGADVVVPGQAFEWGYIAQIPGHTAATNLLTDAIKIEGDSNWSTALRADGSILSWGRYTSTQTNSPTSGVYTNIDAGWTHGIAVDNAGNVVEWGCPYYDGITCISNEWILQRPAGVTNNTIVAVAAADAHSVALDENGVVYVWGTRASNTNQNEVVTDAVAIDAGWYNTLVLKSDGTLAAFGEYSIGSKLNGHENTVPDFARDDFVGIVCGTHHNLAWRADGSMVAWGLNDQGQSEVPEWATSVVGAGAGLYHSVVLLADGTVRGWGRNTEGQLTIPGGLTSASYVSAGLYHTLAIAGDPPGWTNATVRRMTAATVNAGIVRGAQ